MKDIIQKYREEKDEAVLVNFKFIHNGSTEYSTVDDLNYNKRKELILFLYNNYGINDKPLIKWLLSQEIKSHREADTSVFTIEICAFMLYKVMEIEDIYTLYEAKFGAGSDLQFTVDIELLFGFDKEKTKTYLNEKQKNKRKNRAILKAIEYYEKNSNAVFKTREQYIEYFENKRIKNIIADLDA
ncbi:MAG: hypothetical protein LBV69_00400 [Bacteroidales bacterium]|jgi:hypothetical protein|nr:hypothetical protein [Bacteroidales bacterium]